MLPMIHFFGVFIPHEFFVDKGSVTYPPDDQTHAQTDKTYEITLLSDLPLPKLVD